MATKPVEEGDIVQVGGHGRGMVVVNPDVGVDATWEGISNAVVCEWTGDGIKYREGFDADSL